MATRTLTSPGAGGFRPSKALVGTITLAVIVGILAVTGVLARARQLVPGLRTPSPTFQTTTVSRGNVVVSVTATGPVAAVNSTPLTFKTSGKITELKVNVGENVKAGQVLAVLDTSDLQTAFNQAQANLQEAQANLAKVQGGATQAQVAVSKVAVDNAQTAAASAQANIAISQTNAANSVKTAQGNVHTAELSLAAAQDALKAAKDQETHSLAADQQAIVNAQKNLAAAQATAAGDVPIQETNLEKAKDALWSAQVSRDQTCSRSSGADCQAANASVGSAETALNAANLQMQQQLKTDQQQVNQAQASLDQANSTLANDKAKLDAAVVSAQNQVKQAQAALDNAKMGVTTAQAQATATVQSAQSQADQALGALKSAQANYNQTVAPPSDADLASAKAQVVNAQAAFDAAKTNLENATLTAPFDAQIAAINGAVGEYVNGGPVPVGGTSLFTLIDPNNLQVTAQVNEADIGKVHLGDPVTFTVNAYPNVKFTGKVLTIQPQGTVVQNVVNYNVTCSIQSTKDATLYPGMTATATIISAEHDGVLTVPNTALSFAQTAVRTGLLQRPTGAGQATNGSRPNFPGGGTRPQGQATAGLARSGSGNGNGFAGRNGNGNANAGQGANGQANVNRGILLTMTNGKLTPVPVTLGLTDGSITEIDSGVQAGEEIVVGQTGGQTGTGGANVGRPAGGPPGGAFFVGR